MMNELNADRPPDPMQLTVFEPELDTVMGHEFCCEVIDTGPGCSNLKTGDIVVSLPVAFDAAGLHAVGFSNIYNGGYAELMVLNEMVGIKVPSGLGANIAAMTEPLAVGVHAAAKSKITSNESAIVLGCGPVGLACIAELKMRGVGPIVAADFSSKRRALAELLGADVVGQQERGVVAQRLTKAAGVHEVALEVDHHQRRLLGIELEVVGFRLHAQHALTWTSFNCPMD